MAKRTVPNARTRPERRNAQGDVRPMTSVGAGAMPKGRGTKPSVSKAASAGNRGGVYVGGP
jgi:hypothetical protein